MLSPAQNEVPEPVNTTTRVFSIHLSLHHDLAQITLHPAAHTVHLLRLVERDDRDTAIMGDDIKTLISTVEHASIISAKRGPGPGSLIMSRRSVPPTQIDSPSRAVLHLEMDGLYCIGGSVLVV